MYQNVTETCFFLMLWLTEKIACLLTAEIAGGFTVEYS